MAIRSEDVVDPSDAARAQRNAQWSSSERYRYQPLERLGDIRLLQVTPVRDQNPSAPGALSVVYDLKHVNLSSAPEYCPISYVWGDRSQLQPLILVHNEHLEISTSLYSAIHTILSKSQRGILYLWADQICIDQENWAERSEQVRLMGKIFEGAHRAMVWLGEPDETTPAADHFIYLLYHSRIRLSKMKDLFDKRNVQALRNLLDIWHVTEDEIETGTAAMMRLADRSWFTRLWTFQEFVVAPRLEFYCGTYRWSRHEPLIAFYATRLLCNARSTGMYHAGCLWKYRLRCEKRGSRQLLQLLSDVIDSGYQCTEPNDRIFAMLGLHTETHTIPVDYSMPVETLMYLTTKSIIAHNHDLRVLSRRRTGHRPDLPSWVPDWTSPTFQWSIDDRRVSFCASKSYPCQLEELADRVLLVRGKAVSRIQTVIDHVFPDHMSGDENELFDHLVGTESVAPEVCAHLTPILRAQGMASDQILAHAIWLLAMTCSGGRLRKTEKELGLAFSADVKGTAGDGGSETARFAAQIDAQEISNRKALTKCKGRKLAILDSPSSPFALVPDCALAGDYVCVLNGSPTPLVLRRSGEYFINQSECYVHGIMYGEAVDWPEGGGEVFGIK